jgi:hypothetical protein
MTPMVAPQPAKCRPRNCVGRRSASGQRCPGGVEHRAGLERLAREIHHGWPCRCSQSFSACPDRPAHAATGEVSGGELLENSFEHATLTAKTAANPLSMTMVFFMASLPGDR